MITMTARSNAASVKAYYRGKDLDAPDLPEPYFGGKTLETLGEVCTAQHFNRMVDLKHPLKPRQKLTQRARKPDPTKTKGNPVVGWDVTTSPVKSFSVAVEFSPYRTELLQAYRDANDRVMKDHVEPLAVTRERKGGRMGDTPTENMAWRSHMHTLTRPVKGIGHGDGRWRPPRAPRGRRQRRPSFPSGEPDTWPRAGPPGAPPGLPTCVPCGTNRPPRTSATAWPGPVGPSSRWPAAPGSSTASTATQSFASWARPVSRHGRGRPTPPWPCAGTRRRTTGG